MKKFIASLGLALAAGLSATPVAAAIVVTFTPAAQHVEIGDNVQVDVTIAGLGAEILSAFDLNFLYDYTVVGRIFRSMDATSAQLQLGTDPVWAVDGTNLGDWGLQGSATDADDVLAANQADSFLLARFSFLADADGVSSFTLGPDLDFERNFVGRDFQTLEVTVNGACIAVGTGACGVVPEPSSYALVALAMAGLVAPRLRRRRQADLA